MVKRGGSFRGSRSATDRSLVGKLYEINWLLPTLVGVLGLVGVIMIFAATEGVWRHGAFQHLVRVAFGGIVMLAIALISIQNAQPVSIEFFGTRSIAIPFGLLLTCTTVIGMIGTVLLQPILRPSHRSADEE